MSNIERIKCISCAQEFEAEIDYYNFFTCSQCGTSQIYHPSQPHEIITQPDTKELEKIQSIKNSLQLKINGERLRILGVSSFNYNEGKAYLIACNHKEIKLLLFLDYTWYHVALSFKNLNTYGTIQAGNHSEVFTGISSFIYNYENIHSFISCGTGFHMKEDSIEVTEHYPDHHLHLTFGLKKKIQSDFILTECAGIEFNPEIFLETQTLECTQCHKEYEVHYLPFCRSWNCPHCQSPFSKTDEDEIVHRNIIRRKFDNRKNTYIFQLALQDTFHIRDVEYKVIGRVVKEDKEEFAWEEFTLWNNQLGVKYLSCYDGNWILLHPVKDIGLLEMSKEVLPNAIYSDSKEYDLFSDYESEIVQSDGEFYGDVFDEGKYEAIEFTARPGMIAYERPENESVCIFKGESVTHDQLKAWAGKPLELNSKGSVGMAEPYMGNMPLGVLYKSLAAFIALMILVQIITSYFTHPISIGDYDFPGIPSEQLSVYNTDPSTPIYSDSSYGSQQMDSNLFIPIKDSPTYRRIKPLDWDAESFDPKPVLSHYIDFELVDPSNTLNIRFHSTLFNNWQDLDYELTEINTGNIYCGTISNEFYSGFEGGEHWEEGSNDSEEKIGSLPKGRYRLKFSPSNSIGTDSTPYDIHLNANEMVWSNMGYGLLLGLIPLVIFILVSYSREMKRWSASPYSPFNTYEDS